MLEIPEANLDFQMYDGKNHIYLILFHNFNYCKGSSEHSDDTDTESVTSSASGSLLEFPEEYTQVDIDLSSNTGEL